MINTDDYKFEHITMNGVVLKNKDIKTSHLFNCIKMWYNHLAFLVGFPEFAFNKKYSKCFKMWEDKTQDSIDILMSYMVEFEQRQDRSSFENDVYWKIKNLLTGRVHEEIKKKMDEAGIRSYEFQTSNINKLLGKRRDNEQRKITNGS